MNWKTLPDGTCASRCNNFEVAPLHQGYVGCDYRTSPPIYESFPTLEEARAWCERQSIIPDLGADADSYKLNPSTPRA